jgi:hypothetical protein
MTKTTISENPAELSEKEYLEQFSGSKKEKALTAALDIRKFEIELYWKRATYFWTFIAATFAGYGALQGAKMAADEKADLSLVLVCVGTVFSFGWFLVNRGSKRWQENWENHVDMLEGEIMGPLYKTVLKRPPASGWKSVKSLLTGPGPYSVSRINQLISLFVTALWALLLVRVARSMNNAGQLRLGQLGIVALTTLTCVAFGLVGRTSEGNYSSLAIKRAASIKPKQ